MLLDSCRLSFWDSDAQCLMQVTDYSRDLEEMQNVTREEYLASLRRCAELTKYVAVSGIVLLLIINARLQKEQWLLKRTLQIPWAF